MASIDLFKGKPWRTVGSKYSLETPFVKVRKDDLELRNGSRQDYFITEKRNFALRLKS